MFITATILIYLITALACVVSIFINEFTKALTSYFLGDKAIKNTKQLTLNPFKYIDPIGFVFMLAFGYGFGKPAEINNIYYKNRDRDTLIVHITPIVANIIFAILFYNLRVFWDGFYFLAHYNLALGLFNLIPIYPLCGEKILKYFLPPNTSMKYMQIEPLIRILLILLIPSYLGSLLNSIVYLFENILQYVVFFK